MSPQVTRAKKGSNMFQPSMTHGHNDQAKRLQEGAEECLKFCHTANKLPQKEESCDWHETKVLAQRKPWKTGGKGWWHQGNVGLFGSNLLH